MNILYFSIQNGNPETVDCNSVSFLLDGDQYRVEGQFCFFFCVGWVSVISENDLVVIWLCLFTVGYVRWSWLFCNLVLLKTRLEIDGWGIFTVIVGAWQPLSLLFVQLVSSAAQTRVGAIGNLSRCKALKYMMNLLSIQ